MKAKTGSSSAMPVRYQPIDQETYPVQIHDPPYFYWRVWCGMYFIVYEKYKNNVKLGYLIVPGEKEVFQFKSLETYVESIKTGQVLCVRK